MWVERESSGYVVFAHTASCCGTQVLDSPVVRAVVIFSLSSVGKKLLLVFFFSWFQKGGEGTHSENPKRAFLEGPPTTAFVVQKLRFHSVLCSQLS